MNKGKHSLYEGEEKPYYYCVYCGQKASSISLLTSSACSRHPNGNFNGKHEPYQGTEKSKYICKYCGLQASSISSLTSSPVPNIHREHIKENTFLPNKAKHNITKFYFFVSIQPVLFITIQQQNDLQVI